MPRRIATISWISSAVLAGALLAGAARAQPFCGDCDELQNGIDILDSLQAARIGAGLMMPMGTQSCTCDMDSSGAIDVIDALLIAKIAVGSPVRITCGAACAAPCPGTLGLSMPLGAVRCGTTTLIGISSNLGTCDLGGYQLRLSWDPTVLELDATYGTRGVRETPQGMPEMVIDTVPGEVTWSGTFPCLSTFTTGLATVRFNVIGMPSSSTSLRLDVDSLTRCDLSTIGPANPRVADTRVLNVSGQACYTSCSASGAVNLSGPGAMVGCGSNFLVRLHADLGTCDLGAYDFQVTWNPAVLALDTGFGTGGVQQTPQGAPASVNTSTPGQVTWSGYFTCPVLGSSDLSTLRFIVVGGSGSSTAISATVRDLVRCDTSLIGPANPRSGTGLNVTVGGAGCAPPGPTVTAIACGQQRSGSFASGLPVEDVADEATTDYYELASIVGGTQELTVSLTGSGDIDLFVGAPGIAGGSQQIGDYPWHSVSPSSTELVLINASTSPALPAYGSGPVAIAVHAFQAGSYTLTVTCGLTPPPTVTTLVCGTPVTGSLMVSGMGSLAASGSTAFFSLPTSGLPAGLQELVFIVGGAAGDMDLYVGDPGTSPGSTLSGQYVQLTGDSSHHSYVMAPAEVATYGGAPIAVAVHADRAGDYRIRVECMTASSTFRYVRHYVYTVGSNLSTSINNSNPIGRDHFNLMLEEWSRVYRGAPAPEFHTAFEVRQWSDPSADPYRALNFDTEAPALDSYTGMFPTNPNRPPGPHTFFVESLMAGGFQTLGISYVDRTGQPGGFGNANVVSVGRSSFTSTSCSEYTYLLASACAHECGHYMGLQHTTQFSGSCGGAVAFWDTYTDTPQCMAGTSCGSCPDYPFAMFPILFDLGCPLSIGQRQDDFSAQQEAAMEANPCPR